MVSVPPQMPTTWPWWHGELAPRAATLRSKVISSGCSTSGGNVQCAPEAMRADAELKARATGMWDKTLTLPAYTLARYMTSEVGSGTIEEMVAVGEAAVNRAKLSGSSILDRLLYRQPVGHPNRGYYGPIHGPGGTSTAPYGRWAATSKDPHLLALHLADLVTSGQSGNFSGGADDQNGLEYFSDPAGNVRKQAADGDFWVGPLAGVNHWHTFLYKNYGKNHPDAKALLERGLWATTQPKPVWSPSMPVEARLGLATVAVIALSSYLAYGVIRRRRA